LHHTVSSTVRLGAVLQWLAFCRNRDECHCGKFCSTKPKEKCTVSGHRKTTFNPQIVRPSDRPIKTHDVMIYNVVIIVFSTWLCAFRSVIVRKHTCSGQKAERYGEIIWGVGTGEKKKSFKSLHTKIYIPLPSYIPVQ